MTITPKGLRAVPSGSRRHAVAEGLGSFFLRFARPIQALAGASFTLYLCHLPILQFVSACMPWPSMDPRSRLIVFSTTLVIIFLLAMVTERKKEPWRRAIVYVLGFGKVNPRNWAR